MEPPRKDQIDAFRFRGLADEFEEYQALLSARFEIDPSDPQFEAVRARREAQLVELAAGLFADDGDEPDSAAGSA